MMTYTWAFEKGLFDDTNDSYPTVTEALMAAAEHIDEEAGNYDHFLEEDGSLHVVIADTETHGENHYTVHKVEPQD